MTTEKKIIALTFDDGPAFGTTDRLLDILEANNAKASFFIIGQNVTEENKCLMKRAVSQGCTIENHSWTHSSMPSLTAEDISEEIKRTSELIEDTVGDSPRFFRPPYIDYDQKMYDLIDLGFICGFGCTDWEDGVTADMRFETVMENAAPGRIILMHDMEGNVQTVEAVAKIIPELSARGYEFVTIRELFDIYGIKPGRNLIYMGAEETRENYE